MLEFILELTYELLSKATSLSKVDKDVVYDKVLYAINQTRTHIKNSRQGNTDRPSAQLSNIWQRTGQELRKIRLPEIQSLADTIEQKSKYWSDPSGYDSKNIVRYEMQLTQLENKLKKISP